MSLSEKIKALADKLELEVHAVERYVHEHIDTLLGLADDNIDAAKEVVKTDVDALAHNVDDGAKDVAAKVDETLK